jgi:N-acetyl-anhydromuramyl-L-alanine amidase AmpD
MYPKLGKPKYITIHTVAFNMYPVHMDMIEKWHKQRGWNRVGYHYLIRKDGNVEQGLDLETRGIHVKGYNKNNIGIVMEGHHDKEKYTIWQTVALRFLCRDLQMEYNIPIENIKGHNEWPDQYKTCPGTQINMDSLREYIHRHRIIEINI